MAYAAYDGSSVRLSIATSKDLKKWVKHPPAFKDFLLTKMGGVFVKWIEGKPIDLYKPKTPERDIRTKAGGIFPEKIGGKYWMLFNEFRIWLAQSDDLITWNALPGPYIGPRKGSELFDNVFVEMGPPPIKTDKGWLVLYHGIDLKDIYRLGFILLDINDPKKIIYRSDQAIFEPSERYEKEGIYDILPGGLDKILNMNTFELRQYLGNLTNKGIMPEVIFCCGAVVVENDLRIYYGAGDTSICTATVSLEKILSLAS
ncbi:hypothetical protein A2V56_02775 [Candidatus Woesebacteria bacterium RBG_19FT_COMBO_42_9]|nr:MAG: hypothetical protein A2V56_02775 [Candidatus Woesebacteria bacterium RBG_19FT_COMBO_42_9]